MGAKKSAGILLYRQRQTPEYFLVHPGGPYWVKKDTGAWSIPKGEYDQEDPREAALREFAEETGVDLQTQLDELGTVQQKGGKTVIVFSAEGDLDESELVSNHIRLEWPPRTGKMISVPEVDKGEWFTFEVALIKINPAQRPLLEKLNERLTNARI